MRKAAGSIAAKSLILASILTLSMTGVYASEDTAKGTLDKLAGQDIPNTDPVQQYPSSGSAYTLTKLQEGGEKPTIANVITKYVYNTETQTMTPIYYKLDLKQTTYGEGSASQTFTLDTEPVKDVEITAKYNDLSDKIYDTEYKDTNYTGTVTEGGDYSNPKQEIHSALQNTSGNTISIENAIFKNNSTVINFNKTSRASSTNYFEVQGGAIYNAGTIENITADFVNNSVTVNKTGRYGYPEAHGGAIYNANTISDITGNFIGNYASGYSVYGGAIYNTGTITGITGNFIGNYASAVHNASGGAIYNYDTNAKIKDITGDFIGNYAKSSDYPSNGGAIYNNGTSQIGNITGDFIGNYAKSSDSSSNGGAIYNGSSSQIGNITGNFIGNYASGYSVNGGAIYNNGTITAITGDFIGNYASASFTAYGGAIYNYDTINNITGDFIGNYAKSSDSTSNGGAIYNTDTINNITGDFIGNYASSSSNNAYGGAIYNEGTIGEIQGRFINNYVKSETGEAKGGAIYTTKDITIVAKDGFQSIFRGNYTESNGIKDDNAIYLDNPEGTLNFKMTNGGSIYMSDNIDGTVKETDGTITSAYKVDIQGDSKIQCFIC